MRGIQVTALDLETGESSSCEVMDDYVIVCAGSAKKTDVQMTRANDGTRTHVITVKGVKHEDQSGWLNAAATEAAE